MFGKLLGSATRIVNAPLDALDNIFDEPRPRGQATRDEDRFASAPLEELAKALDDADRGWEE